MLLICVLLASVTSSHHLCVISEDPLPQQQKRRRIRPVSESSSSEEGRVEHSLCWDQRANKGLTHISSPSLTYKKFTVTSVIFISFS